MQGATGAIRMQTGSLKLIKDNCHLRWTSVPFYGEGISTHGMRPDPWKLKSLTEIPPKVKKELQAFLGMINYLSKFSSSIADICESFRKLTSIRAEWTRKVTYKIFNKAKSITKEGACMKFYDETKPLHIDTDVSGHGLLQTRGGTSFPRDGAPDNSILISLAFVSKNLLRKKIQQHRKRSTKYTVWTQKIQLSLICRTVEYNHRSQTPSSNIQKRYSNTIIEITMNSA